MDSRPPSPAYIPLSTLYRRAAEAIGPGDAEAAVLDALAAGVVHSVLIGYGPRERSIQLSKSDWLETWQEDHPNGPKIRCDRQTGLFASVKEDTVIFIDVWTDCETGEQYHEPNPGEIWVLAQEADQLLTNVRSVHTYLHGPRIKERHHTRGAQHWVQKWLEEVYSNKESQPATKDEAFERARADYSQQHPDQRLSRRQFDAAWRHSAPEAAQKGGRRARKT